MSEKYVIGVDLGGTKIASVLCDSNCNILSKVRVNTDSVDGEQSVLRRIKESIYQLIVGHLHGKSKLTDIHPSSDYIFGQIGFENGIRAFLECGYLSISNMEKNYFWVDNRLTVYGTRGYAWAETNGAWGAYINGEYLTEQGESWEEQEMWLQKPYLKDFADWLDNDDKIHPCNLEISYHGYEILEGLCMSALENKRIDLPINTENFPNLIERMKKEVSDNI